MPGSARQPIRWGVLGTGVIASKFATDLARTPDTEVRAVGSRSGAAADAFAERFGIPVRHVGYQALVEDPAIDVVYVALPHPAHHAWALTALEEGKAVLCEKPFTVTAAEARDLVATARREGRFLMEAMWTRFLPSMVRVREILDSGVLGEVRTVHADLGIRMHPDPAGRLFAPELGGGALLDLGIYPVSFASFVLGSPQSVTAVATPTATGVDAQTSVILRYGSGAHAALNTTLEVDTPGGAVVAGSEGRLELSGPLFDPSEVRLVRGRQPGGRGGRGDPPERSRPRMEPRGGRGRPLSARGAPREPHDAARRVGRDHGDAGRDPAPGRPPLPVRNARDRPGGTGREG